MKYVSRDDDRHGNVRYYYRRDDRRVRLDGEPGTELFDRSLANAEAAYEPRRKREKKATSFVYFITFGQRKVKIGTCQNVAARMKTLRTGIPGKSRVFYVTPGSRALERELHELFAIDRISGEWFQFSKDIRSWIDKDQNRREKSRGVNASRSKLCRTSVVAPSNV